MATTPFINIGGVLASQVNNVADNLVGPTLTISCYGEQDGPSAWFGVTDDIAPWGESNDAFPVFPGQTVTLGIPDGVTISLYGVAGASDITTEAKCAFWGWQST